MTLHFHMPQSISYGTDACIAQCSYKVCNCNWILFSSKSLPYIAIALLYSWMKTSPLDAFNKRFSSLTYVLKSSGSNRSSVALMIKPKDPKQILRYWEMTCWRIQVLLFHRKIFLFLLVLFFFLDNSGTLTLFLYVPHLLRKDSNFVRPHLLKCINMMLCYCLSFYST